MVIRNLYFLFRWASSDVGSIVKLGFIILDGLHHIRTHNRIMCIRVKLNTIEDLNEGVSKTDSHSINKNVTWHDVHTMNTGIDEG